MDCDENEIKDDSQINKDSGDLNSLLNQFNSLNTNEKDDLVVAFQNIANELSYTTARFFLEMNNWNLQAAVGCYFDFLASSNQNSAAVPMPSMRIVEEITVGIGESVTPNTQFTQSWLLENNGDVTWPSGCYLKLVSEINNDGKMFVPPISPRDSHVITINLVSPQEIGQFRSQFCLCTPNGTTFGPIIWSVVDVSIAGTLALTQQLTQLHTSSQPPSSAPKTTNISQQSTGWEEEDGMDGSGGGGGGASQNTLNSIIPSTNSAFAAHCSNNGIVSDSFAIANQTQLPAPQNSPNTHDEEMFEKINSHNL